MPAIILILSLLLSSGAAIASKPMSSTEDFVMSSESPYSLEETVERIERATSNNNFRHIRTQKVAKNSDGDIYAVYFCSFSMLEKALQVDKRIGSFLPCRITIYSDAGQVKASAFNPKLMSALTNQSRLHGLCDTVKEGFSSIIDEATL